MGKCQIIGDASECASALHGLVMAMTGCRRRDDRAVTLLPRVADEVEAADFDTEIVVLVPSRRKTHLLEPMLALLFDSCRDGADDEAFLTELVEATGLTHEDAERWMADALRELTALGVIDPL
jgi:hypothetical protein